MADDDDRGAARIATASALIVVAAFVASKAARDAILLSHFEIRSLPIFTGIAAIVSLPLTIVFGALMTRVGPARLMPPLHAASALLAVGEWFLMKHQARFAVVLIYFHLSISGAVLVSGFWSIVNERFDVQTAKRHIGRIGMGATLGGIAGGLIAERTGAMLHHDEKILIVIAVLQMSSAIALARFGRGARRTEAHEAPPAWEGLRVVTKSRLLRQVAVVVVLGAVAAGTLDYVFKADLVRAASHGRLLRSLSIFYTVTGVLTAIVQVALCGPLVARLGVPRTVASLPVMTTAASAVALASPGVASSVIARGTELVVRNSLYRSGYELLYAPMAEDHKRPTKVVLDVGADRIGDLLGAQLVAMIVYQTLDPRFLLLAAAVAIGALAALAASRLPKSYTEALEESLRARAAEAESEEATPPDEPWLTLPRLPTLGDPGEAIMLARRRRARERRDAAPISRAPPQPSPASVDAMLHAIAALRSSDPARVKAALGAPLVPELAAHAIDLVGRDDVARDALVALHDVAARCTGLLVDALLDRSRDPAVRRRLPAVLATAEPSLAAFGLWRALDDPSFDVRYRAGAVLARLAAEGHLDHITPEEVFDAVKRELLVDPDGWRARKLADDLVYAADGDDAPFAGTGLEHVFTVLGLTLPAEPLRIALHAVHTDDPALRGTALEYLESILPADLRAQLWPLLEGIGVIEPAPRRRSLEELRADLERTYPRVVARLTGSGKARRVR